MPRHTSKILSNVKKEDNRGEKRALQFVGEGSTLRKGGTIEKKDLSKYIIAYYYVKAVAMSAEDWETKYKEIWGKFQEERKR